MACMSQKGPRKKKMPTASTESRKHKAGLHLRMPEAMLDQLEALAERNLTNLTIEARTAIKRWLEENNLWPPPGGR
jgi:hypothetical protein